MISTNRTNPARRGRVGKEVTMVLIVMMMVMLCVSEALCDLVAGCIRLFRSPQRSVTVRARQYRFN